MSMESMEPFESAANLNEDVGMFEAATHCPFVELPIPSIKTIVLALDGSDRDPTAKAFADSIAARTGARIEERTGLTSASAILTALGEHHPDLLILPVPFGQDYNELGCESLGSVIDLLLLKSPCPVLCVRDAQDRASVEEALDHVIVPVAVADELVPRALGWGFHITSAGGRLDLVAVADRDVLAEASHLSADAADCHALASDELSRAITRDIAGLVSAAQKHGSAQGRAVHVETRIGKFIPLVLAELHGHPRLIIWCITREHSTPAFNRAVDLLLASTGPVLMV